MLWSIPAAASLLDVRHTVYSLTGNWSTPMDSVVQFFYILVLVAIVGGLAYYTTRLVGSARYGRGGRRNLEIIESMGVGPQSFIHVIRVGGQYVLIGVTRGQINLITQIEADTLKLPEDGHKIQFESIFNKFIKSNNEKPAAGPPDNGKDNGP